MPIRNKANLKLFWQMMETQYIRKHNFRPVTINGAVLSLKISYGWRRKSYDLIEKSGGYTENAYPFGAVYENDMAFSIDAMQKKNFIKSL